MRFLCAAFLFLLTGSASAQTFQTDRLTGNTVFMAIQCDVGRFGKEAKMMGIDPSMKAHVKYSWKVEKAKKLSVKAEISLSKFLEWLTKGPNVEASIQWSRTNDDGIEGDFNIHEGNIEACNEKAKPRVPVGLWDCLTKNKLPIKAKIQSTCKRTLVAAGKLTAKGTIRWLIFEVEPSGDFDLKVTYDIAINAPAREQNPQVSRN